MCKFGSVEGEVVGAPSDCSPSVGLATVPFAASFPRDVIVDEAVGIGIRFPVSSTSKPAQPK